MNEELERAPVTGTSIVAAVALMLIAFALILLVAYVLGLVGHLALRTFEWGWSMGA